MHLFELLEKFSSVDCTINFSSQQHIFHFNSNCPKYHVQRRLCPNKYYLRCTGSFILKEQTIKQRCNSKLNLKINNFFDNRTISKPNICRFFSYKLSLQPPQGFFMKELDISDPTTANLNKLFRRICLLHINNNFDKIGGVRKIVEVDETRFGPGVGSAGAESGYWVVGCSCRETKMTFTEIIENRFRKQLFTFIHK